MQSMRGTILTLPFSWYVCPRRTTGSADLRQVPSVNLVYQQAQFLESNLDHNIARACGAMGSDLWTKARWQTTFAENKVIVCTPEVLYQCLMHAFICIESINLLIFDEAHHPKKRHPYARQVCSSYVLIMGCSLLLES